MSYSDRAWRAALVCIAAVSTLTCARSPQHSIDRIAIVSFENLSSNADLNWMGRAIAAVAAAQTAGNERLQTFPVSGVREAQSRLAIRTVDGYLTHDGGRLSLKTTLRDEPTGRTTSATAVSATDVFAVAGEIARQTGAPVSAYTTSNAAALEAHMRALGQTDAAAIEKFLREAIRLDPHYGAPYLALRDVLLRTNRAEEAQLLLANASGLRWTVVEKARMHALSARNPREQVDALLTVAKYQPGDTVTLHQAAGAAMNLRMYDKALVAIEELLKLSPNDEVPLNMRGYAYIYAGNFAAAQSAFEEYRKRAPESANAIDSMAEMMFYFRRYADAGKLFMEAHAKNPGILNGAEPFRAAYSHYLSGNLAGADRLFAALVNDPKDIRYAVWRKWTGRPPGEAPAVLRAYWALQSGDRTTATSLASAARQTANNPALANLASVVVLLSQPSASPDEWRARLQKAVPAPQQEIVRNQLLGWALLLDGHAGEAATHWRAILDRTSGQFDNEQRIMLAASLLAAGRPDDARKVMPYGFLPPANLSLGLDLLLYPLAVDTARKLHQ